MNNIAIILARGGSKGLPRKNVLPLLGKPLIAHTIDHACHAHFIDHVFVSTDDDEIASISAENGASIIMRSAELAADDTTSEEALLHALHYLEKKHIQPTYIAFLQCTSPLREKDSLDHALKLIEAHQADSLLSVCFSHRFLWEKEQFAKSINYDYAKRPRRQDMSQQYVENGSIYIFKPTILKNNKNRLGGRVSLYVMPDWCQYEIDTSLDFTIVEAVMKNYMMNANDNR